MPCDAILFDLDGTLLDSLEDLADAVNHALSLHGLPRRSLAEVRAFVGSGVRKLVERSAGFGPDDARYAPLFAAFQDYYAVHCGDATAPYPGIPELLAELKTRGFLLAVVSNKQDREVRALVERHFPGMCSATAGERPGIPRKPDPAPILNVIAELGTQRSRVIYVGDSDVDARTAANAGVPLAAVTWGYRSVEQLKEAGAERFIDSPQQLLELL